MLTRTALLTSAFALVATSAHADQRSEAMLTDFVAWIDSSPLWTATSGAVRSDGNDTVLADLTIGLEEMPELFSAKIAELRLTGLAAKKGGGFTADGIAISDASTATYNLDAATGRPQNLGIIEYSIPSATMTDVSMPSFAGMTFDMERFVSSIIDIYAVVAQGEFSALSIPEMSAVIQQSLPDNGGNVESNVTYRDFRIVGLADGVIQSQTAGPISGSVTQPGAPDVSYVVERLEAGPMDFGAMMRIIDDSAYEGGRGDGVWMPIVTDVAYRGITARGEGFSFSLDSISLDSLEGRQMDEPVMAEIDAMIAEGIAGAADPVDSERMAQLVLGFYSAWRVGTFSMDGLNVDAQAEATTFSLDSIAFSGLSADGLDSFTVSGMDLASPEAVASLGLFEIEGFAFPNLRPMIFGESAAPAGADPRDQQAYSILASLPRIDHIGMHDLAGGQTADALVKLGSFTLDFAEWNEIFAGATDLVVEGLEIPRNLPGLDAPTLQMLDTLGYDSFVLSASLTDRWSPEEGRDEAVWTLSLQDGADIEVGYTLTGITAEWVIDALAAESEATQMKLLSRLGLAAANLRLTDRSLLDRGFNAAAMLQGLNVDGPTYREQIRGAIPFMLSTAVPETIARMISDPLTSYLGGGQTLIAEINPAEPISLLELQNAQTADPAETAEMLGLTVRTEQAAPTEPGEDAEDAAEPAQQ